MIDNAPHALGRVVQEVAQESAQNPSVASAAVVARVAKREGEVRNRNLRGAEAAAKARAKRENMVVGARDQHLEPARKAGVLLVGPGKENLRARRRAQLLRFTLASDPLDFVARVFKAPSSAKKGHVAIASPRRHRLCTQRHDRCGPLGMFSDHASRFPASGRNTTRHYVQGEVQGPDTEFPCGCISRARCRFPDCSSAFEKHSSGPWGLFPVLFVRTRVVQVFQENCKDGAADAAEHMCSL